MYYVCCLYLQFCAHVTRDVPNVYQWSISSSTFIIYAQTQTRAERIFIPMLFPHIRTCSRSIHGHTHTHIFNLKYPIIHGWVLINPQTSTHAECMPVRIAMCAHMFALPPSHGTHRSALLIIAQKSVHVCVCLRTGFKWLICVEF